MFPELRVIVGALISGLPSYSFVMLIVFIFFYIGAIIGVLLFSSNDYARFGTIQMALLTLWRQATFDSWSDPVYTNMFGCNYWLFSYGRPSSSTIYTEFELPATIVKRDHALCNHPNGMGWVAALYFVTVVLFGAQVRASPPRNFGPAAGGEVKGWQRLTMRPLLLSRCCSRSSSESSRSRWRRQKWISARTASVRLVRGGTGRNEG